MVVVARALLAVVQSMGNNHVMPAL